MESAPYVQMTQNVLSQFGVRSDDFSIVGSFPFRSPGTVQVEGDWSNAAFYLAAAKLGSRVTVDNLNTNSCQGDRAVTEILDNKDNFPVISAADIPDLVPILAVYFASQQGAVFTDIRRLRLKESDRILSITNLLHALGIKTKVDDNTLQVFAGKFSGGTVDACADHRIAMAAGIAATVADGPVNILGAECVSKSYPTFWQEYMHLGGKYEQYIR